MRTARRLLTLSLVLTASAALAWACSDINSPSRPAIPSISAQKAGQTYCAEWSCSYDTCHTRPGYDPQVGSCCLQYTLNIGEAQPAPQCSTPPDIGGSCPGEYALDGGYSRSSSTDDQWFCPISLSCCSGGSPASIYYVCGASQHDVGPCSNPNGSHPPIP
jgi:hypothetical protein